MCPLQKIIFFILSMTCVISNGMANYHQKGEKLYDKIVHSKIWIRLRFNERFTTFEQRIKYE
jgi:hypothetical protein